MIWQAWATHRRARHIGWAVGDERHAGALTTPDPVALHRTLSGRAGRGVDNAASEASRHGLAQYRRDGISVAAAAFTNLTRDHLDYHGNMESYRAAKDRVFTALLTPKGTAVLNADSPEYPRLAALVRGQGHKIVAYGVSGKADLRLISRRPRRDGQHVRLSLYGEAHGIELKLIGDFQALNVLAAH